MNRYKSQKLSKENFLFAQKDAETMYYKDLAQKYNISIHHASKIKGGWVPKYLTS